MYGFGTIQPKDINQIVTALEKQISDIKSSYASDYSVISNKIEKCETYLSKLKEYIKVVQDYTETEYQKLQTQIESFESQINELKENLNQVNYSKAGQETVAVGIAPLNEYSATSVTHPFSAKYAVNDSEGNNIVGTYATKDELNNAGQQYSNELSSVSATLQENIATEVNRATESEQYLTDNLTGEVTRSMGAENTIATDLSNEVTRATNKENQLQQSIETLTNTVNAKETSLSAQIEAETTRATTKENELETAIANEVTARISAVNNLETEIANEAISRHNEIDVVANNLTEEVNRATSAEEVLDSKIDSSVETLNGTISELNTTFSQALTQEQNTRSSADATLQANIDTEATTRADAISGLQNALETETENRTSADNHLQTQIDAIEATQNVIDLVSNYTALTEYNTSSVKPHDKIQVINDETSGYQTTIYSWENSAWSGIGLFGPYYTQAQVDNLYNELDNTKQDNLSAGDGIAITENVISHSVKIIESDNYDTVVGTKLTVYLKNNKYKKITFNKTITDIEFVIEKSENNVLQETGFEFTCPEESELENVTFSVLNDNSIKILTIIPDSYTSPNVYQGTIVNYKCTIGEFEVED